jgi:hypothetical protein
MYQWKGTGTGATGNVGAMAVEFADPPNGIQ